MANLGLHNYHKKDSTDDLLELLFSSNDPKESTIPNYPSAVGSFYIGDNSEINSDNFDEGNNEPIAYSQASNSFHVPSQGSNLQVQTSFSSLSSFETQAEKNIFSATDFHKTSTNIMHMQTNIPDSKNIDSKSMFPFSFYSANQFQEAMVKLPISSSTAFSSSNSNTSELHPDSSLTSQSLIDTINHSLSSIPRNSSLANALNDFEKAYEKVKRKNEESDRLQDCKIPKLETSLSQSNSQSSETVRIPSVSSFCALLAESNSNDASGFNTEMCSTTHELQLPYQTTSLNHATAMSYSMANTSNVHDVEPSRSVVSSTQVAEYAKSTCNTVPLQNEFESLLDGVIHGESSSNQWNNPLIVKHEGSKSQSTDTTVLHKLLTVSTASKITQSFVKHTSKPNGVENLPKNLCPACKKSENLTALNDSSLILCSACINALQHSVKSESPDGYNKKEKAFASTSSIKQTLLPKQVNSRSTADSKNDGIVAHLVAINPTTTESTMSSAVPLYMVIDGKAIPLTVAQVQSNISTNNNSPKLCPIKPNTSESTVTSASAAAPRHQKNSIKIAPLPLLSAQSGSSLIIAGVTPGTEAQTVEKPSSEKRAKPSNNDALRIHGCTYPNCNKRYFKSSHLKAHIR